jgi:ligand-binding sensor domain-containing protein
MATERLTGSGALLFVMGAWLLSLLAALGSPIRTAMTNEYRSRQYTMEHGLPDKEVRDILQTRDGYLWVLTQWGIARFDGLKFVVFRHANTPEFEDESCLSLVEDVEGNLWIGARDHMLQMKGNQFRRWLRAPDKRAHHITRIAPSREGGVWSGSKGVAVHVTPTNTTTFTQEHGLNPHHPILALQEDHEGVLWAGSTDGLLCFDSEKNWFEAVRPASGWGQTPLPVTALHRGADLALWAIFAEIESRFAYGTNALLGRLQHGRWDFFPPAGTFDFNFSAVSSFIFEDRGGNVWFSANQGALHRLRAGSLELVDAIPAKESSYVLSVHEDHEGNLWMGSGQSGLWRWQPRRIQSYTTNEGLPHPNVWALCEGSDGNLWVGTDGGVSRLGAGQGDTWTEADGLSRNSTRALGIDKEGTVWIGTSSGLNVLHNGELTQRLFPGEWFEGKIRTILPARDGAVWVGAATGLNRLQGDTRVKLATADGLAHNDVRALLEDSAGRLWIGTFGGGLQSYHEGRFTTYTTNHGLSSSPSDLGERFSKNF